jgi:hypothetical protein
MSNLDKYRMHVEECRQKADAVADAQARESWLQLASVWMQLVQQAVQATTGGDFKQNIVLFRRF